MRGAANTRRTGLALGILGAALVLAAIPTNSALLVGLGATLVVIGHLLSFLSYFRPRRS